MCERASNRHEGTLQAICVRQVSCQELQEHIEPGPGTVVHVPVEGSPELEAALDGCAPDDLSRHQDLVGLALVEHGPHVEFDQAAGGQGFVGVHADPGEGDVDGLALALDPIGRCNADPQVAREALMCASVIHPPTLSLRPAWLKIGTLGAELEAREPGQ